jgi:predicted small secreted protein
MTCGLTSEPPVIEPVNLRACRLQRARIILESEDVFGKSNTVEEAVMSYRFVLALAAMACMSGCNTMHGIGEDVSAGGRKVEDVLKKDKSTDRSSTTPGNSSSTTTTPSATTPSSPATTGPATDRSTTPSDSSMSRSPSSTTTQ